MLRNIKARVRSKSGNCGFRRPRLLKKAMRMKARFRGEARHRLKPGKGIRGFSRPDKLKGAVEISRVNAHSRAHLITDAGQLIPGYSLADKKIEFFVHSPFATQMNGNDGLFDRNIDS